MPEAARTSTTPVLPGTWRTTLSRAKAAILNAAAPISGGGSPTASGDGSATFMAIVTSDRVLDPFDEPFQRGHEPADFELDRMLDRTHGLDIGQHVTERGCQQIRGRSSFGLGQCLAQTRNHVCMDVPGDARPFRQRGTAGPPAPRGELIRERSNPRAGAFTL